METSRKIKKYSIIALGWASGTYLLHELSVSVLDLSPTQFWVLYSIVTAAQVASRLYEKRNQAPRNEKWVALQEYRKVEQLNIKEARRLGKPVPEVLSTEDALERLGFNDSSSESLVKQ